MTDKYTAFTLLDWDDKTRPEVQIHDNVAILYTGGHHHFEIAGQSQSDLKDQLEGYAEIFKDAAESLGD